MGNAHSAKELQVAKARHNRHGPGQMEARRQSHQRVARQNLLERQSRGLRRAGTAYGGWTYNASMLLGRRAVVYSVGIGEDTSWDEALLREHAGLRVWGFDPTPRAAAYVVRVAAALGPRFHFTQEGLATRAGNFTFTKPAGKGASMRMGRHAAMGGTLEARVDTLEAWMRQRGHAWIDVLKLDVEGAEYSVLEDLAQRDVLPFSQLLVEFHKRWLPDQRRHQRLLARLQARGVRKVHVHNDQEVAFLNDRFVELSTPVGCSGRPPCKNPPATGENESPSPPLQCRKPAAWRWRSRWPIHRGGVLRLDHGLGLPQIRAAGAAARAGSHLPHRQEA